MNTAPNNIATRSTVLLLPLCYRNDLTTVVAIYARLHWYGSRHSRCKTVSSHPSRFSCRVLTSDAVAFPAMPFSSSSRYSALFQDRLLFPRFRVHIHVADGMQTPVFSSSSQIITRSSTLILTEPQDAGAAIEPGNRVSHFQNAWTSSYSTDLVRYESSYVRTAALGV